ncbi:aminoacyl-histidine dipeptidase [Mariniflexile sp. AS56]|uniref:aminoacyl-histidine dipeptidase n=1 Tax=Mariniflexile sp. AS56 TaxID=3063957 RepID=UPI0026EA78E8|nr:aminoacyl-histidine dipeptidase [Mariniflexile sp. AS56]MDO7171438.1 aminoacyl-histidine dipeptidase [Mariniflexile sp. AS56]
MSELFKDLKPNTIWQHFDAINEIPRASTKEEKIIEYMVDFGNALGLETIADRIGNVIIKKPASIGKENSPTVVLQGHLDMVHQKEVNSDFDFKTQGIQMYIEGDWIKAKGTTLGADNGIGVAAIMAVLSSVSIEHPQIEALFTIDEEVGMTGAEAIQRNQLSGRILLNLDTEEEDEIIIGCAGGVDVEIEETLPTEVLDENYNFFEIKIDGLTGGHSGMDIHLNRANAIKVLAIVLNKLEAQIAKINSGTLTNVIPRYGNAIIAVKSDYNIVEEIGKIQEQIRVEFSKTDKELSISLNKVSKQYSVLKKDAQTKFLKALQEIPHGVYSFTKGMSELVQTSNNVAKINLEEGYYNIACHTRSSVDTERDVLVAKIKDVYNSATVNEVGPYPGWKPQPNSNLLTTAKSCFKTIHNKEAQVKSIHAGLECGILSGTFPDMEMVSFGPNIRGAHSPEERLQISSTQIFWELLVMILDKV